MVKNVIELEPGRDYNNVYFMVVDAKEHSKIVRYNDADKVDKAFDEFETMVHNAVERGKTETRCEIAQSWGWQGDGGLYVFYDQEESIARKATLQSAKEILAEIPALNNRLSRMKISGEIHVRIAIHKGNIRYKEKTGSIHSKELNLASHVQKLVPYDTIAISKDVYDISGETQNEFVEAEGEFEGMKFYLYSSRPKKDILEEWRRNLPLTSGNVIQLESDVPIEELGLVGAFSQRALTYEYVSRIREAKNHIWVMGIGLGGFQSNHRANILVQKALEGVDIRLLVVDPDIQIKLGDEPFSLPSWCDFSMDAGNYNQNSLYSAIKMVNNINRQIQQDNSAQKQLVKIKYYKVIPSFAMLRVDSIIYFSPYFSGRSNLKAFTLKLTEGGRLYEQCIKHFELIWNNNRYSREVDDVSQG